MIEIVGLSKTYAGTGRPALNDVSLQVPKEPFTASSAAAAQAKVR
jgi:ABC-type ATPase involved in cell division